MGDDGSAVIKIYDEGGKAVKSEQLRVMSKETITINISSLASGVYYAEINVDGIINTEKFIKQ